MKPHKLVVLCGVLLALVGTVGCGKYVNALKARDHLNKGVGAFRNAQFQQAIVHFKTAVDLDPALLNARLYLATAYAQQYIPGGDSPDNIKVGEQAIAAFEDVLQQDPNNLTAIASMAQIYYNMKNFDKAKEFQRKRIELSPQDAEPYYWIGVINWAIAYPRAQQVRKDLNLAMPRDPARPDILPPIPERERAKLEAENKALVEEGIEALTKAIELKPNDDAAMAYINLLYRQKAEYEADPAARAAHLKQADDWVEKALNVKKSAAAAAAAAVR
jgi:tetratricopeptide (TPR) repeat protein